MEAITRAILRRLNTESGLLATLDLKNDQLRQSLESWFDRAGVTVASGEEEAPPAAAIFDLQDAPSPRLLPVHARSMLEGLQDGATVVVIFHSWPNKLSPEFLAETWRPCLAMKSAHGEIVDDALVISGPLRQGLDNRRMKELRGLGHSIQPSVLVGRAGITEELVGNVRVAVERHGLIKVKLTPQCQLEKVSALTDIAWASGSQLIQRVGKMGLLYRAGVSLDPPVKRNRRH